MVKGCHQYTQELETFYVEFSVCLFVVARSLSSVKAVMKKMEKKKLQQQQNPKLMFSNKTNKSDSDNNNNNNNSSLHSSKSSNSNDSEGSINNLLTDLYFSLESPAAFTGINSLYKLAKTKHASITLDHVKKFLSQQLSYSLHKPIVRQFSTRPVIVYHIDEQWQIDLVDMSKLSKANKGFKYIMVIIDVFSKYAWLEPLKTKTGIEISKALQKVFNESKRSPRLIQIDKGTEFLNSSVRSLLRSRSIKLFTTFSERKASVVERLNRTLKARMWRYFTKFRTRTYIDNLQKIVTSYNNAYHRSIKCSPAEVNKDNEVQVWINMYEKRLNTNAISHQSSKKKKKTLFNVGDTVRISIERGVFRKGYLQG